MNIEIVIDGPRNENLQFRPLQRTLRGTFDLNRVPEPLARMKTAEWPRPIPGMRISVDPDKATAIVIEPLHSAEHASMRARVESIGVKLGPAVEPFESIDVPTWLYWMRRAVGSGVAKIVDGKFPAIDEAKVQKNFITKPQTDPRDNLINKLIGVLYAGLSAERRKEVADLIGT
jgi:hypothetical protein